MRFYLSSTANVILEVLYAGTLHCVIVPRWHYMINRQRLFILVSFPQFYLRIRSSLHKQAPLFPKIS